MESKMATMPVTQESLAAIVARRYQVDADFRAEFDKDPKAAVSRITGLKMPTGSEIVVHRNEDNHWHISLPSAARTSELKDEDIASVSGGARHEPTWSDLWGRPDPEAEKEMDQFMNHKLPDLMRSVGAIGP